MLKVNQSQLATLNANLQEMSEKAGKKAMRQAARKAMVPVRDQVKESAPVDTSPDADNIRIKDNVAIRTKWDRDALTVKVGILGGAKQNPETPFHFRFAEFGTKDRPAAPFMAPALEGNAQEVLDTVAEELRKALGL